ncbi:MAG: hypothetical protein HKN47_12375 [Pirellulaceae bacterium]|nr:hypothetical protein [Pirellulaceae bacterium]
MKKSESDELRMQPNRSDVAALLETRLTKIESEINSLRKFLKEQAKVNRKRRRRLTLRVLLFAVAIFAGLFAWVSAIYQTSLQQAAAVDYLVAQGVFVSYEPRESLLIAALPGDPTKPPRVLLKSLGVDFFQAATNVSTRSNLFRGDDQKRLIPTLASLNQLQRLRIANLILSTADLRPLAKLRNLESLDLTRARLDNGGLHWLPNTQLRWFAAAHTYLGDTALHDLSRCPDLRYLDLERTTVTGAGLQHLYKMKSLRYLNLKRCPVTRSEVSQLATAIPNCVIDWEPLVLNKLGKVNGSAAINGRVQFGRPNPNDPRAIDRPQPPVDRYDNPRFYRSFLQPYPQSSSRIRIQSLRSWDHDGITRAT